MAACNNIPDAQPGSVKTRICKTASETLFSVMEVLQEDGNGGKGVSAMPSFSMCITSTGSDLGFK